MWNKDGRKAIINSVNVPSSGSVYGEGTVK